MRRIEPKVYLIGESRINRFDLAQYLESVGAPLWLDRHPPSDGPDGVPDGELLVEAMGRLCYRSWEPGLNANVKKVRTDRAEYLRNILDSGHGSVLEHPVSHWIFADVSRVFTHEFVRHRAGMAFSQESLRFVRLTDLGLWLPPEVEENPRAKALFEQTFRSLEELQGVLSECFGLDGPGVNFAHKKKMTSAMRRAAPIGLATAIGATFNARALRHILTMRTASSAESEMRLVFGKVAKIAKERWPLLFQDFVERADGSWEPEFKKV